MAITETLPKTIWIIDVPTRPDDLAKRWHNKFAKDALRETLERWHKSPQGFKKHYRRDARQRYNHFPRSDKYKRFKARKYHSTIDHIKTGRSKHNMEHGGKVTISGTAEGKNLSATLTLRFPFKGGTGRARQNRRNNRFSVLKPTQQMVSIQKMIIELKRMDSEDPPLLARWFFEAYMKKVRDFRSNRKRIRVSR